LALTSSLSGLYTAVRVARTQAFPTRAKPNPVPLVHAPREIRINALKRFRSLEMALKVAATDAIAAIDEASGEVFAAPRL